MKKVTLYIIFISTSLYLVPAEGGLNSVRCAKCRKVEHPHERKEAGGHFYVGQHGDKIFQQRDYDYGHPHPHPYIEHHGNKKQQHHDRYSNHPHFRKYYDEKSQQQDVHDDHPSLYPHHHDHKKHQQQSYDNHHYLHPNVVHNELHNRKHNVEGISLPIVYQPYESSVIPVYYNSHPQHHDFQHQKNYKHELQNYQEDDGKHIFYLLYNNKDKQRLSPHHVFEKHGQKHVAHHASLIRNDQNTDYKPYSRDANQYGNQKGGHGDSSPQYDLGHKSYKHHPISPSLHASQNDGHGDNSLQLDYHEVLNESQKISNEATGTVSHPYSDNKSISPSKTLKMEDDTQPKARKLPGGGTIMKGELVAHFTLPPLIPESKNKNKYESQSEDFVSFAHINQPWRGK